MVNAYWWKNSTVYQIYPKSFCDSSNKGTGDIKGIISKLDYLKLLGIDAIWLTPIYASPMIDNGYDISDYYAINPDFGTMKDFETLLKEAHQHDIRIIMDIVVNHTSTEHSWFKEAQSNINSPYRDYYTWKDPINNELPNNWQSKFGGSAWEYDSKSNQYYLHLFAKEQADLNWENPKVREEVKKVIAFWAEKGVDGFRLDVINLISKDQAFPNDNEGDGRRFYTDGPKAHKYLQEISQDIFQKYGSVTVGEMSSTTLEHCQKYSSLDGKELSMVFNFHHLKVDYPNNEKWSLAPFDFVQLKSIFNHWQKGLHNNGWGALFWCNHDQPRIVSRFGNDTDFHDQSAKMLAATLHFMQGTPYIYQGEEIGMTNPYYLSIEEYRDVESTNIYQIMVNDNKEVSHNDMIEILGQKSRDNSRSPMQWNSSKNAGFTQGTPWINVAQNYKEINVKSATSDPKSIFYFYQKLIQLRKNIDVITTGDYEDLCPENKSIFAYSRKSKTQQLICINNFYGEETSYLLPADIQIQKGKFILGNYNNTEAFSREFILQPYETKVILINF